MRKAKITETTLVTPHDDDGQEASAAEPVSARVLQSASTRFQSRSGHCLGNPPSTRRIPESPREMPGGFSGLASLRDGGPGVKANSREIRHRLTHAPLKYSFDFSKPARPTLPGQTLPAPGAQPSPPQCALKTENGRGRTVHGFTTYGPHGWVTQ